MKQLRFSCMFLFATVIVFLTSCGGGGGEKTTTDSTGMGTDSTVVAETPMATSTIVTTPQNIVVVKHQVTNFEKWLPHYEAHDSMRMVNKLHSYVIGRGVKDANMVIVVVKAEDMALAKTFSKAQDLKDAMRKGGVKGTPTFDFVTMVFQDTATISSDLRASSTFKVKDWDAWVKAFEEGKQKRLDNGITVRAYGHDVDDDHKVFLVTAITDADKAEAYIQSDELKKRREAAGVIGEPERFMFRVVKRY
ncbi:hypothetical protein [Chitinophaga tropicalis]|uniref:Uncharacterized protein n=1 Tax=Chitinophaga tropicalis TaxID=2683588 RepID=A0A7K1UDM7_9BACT|nr:hypothetical protein [Chitinophaga tropicalis]MVT12368.1 hypothetical protein [Chitinophaga tropicalis]